MKEEEIKRQGGDRDEREREGQAENESWMEM